VIVLPVQTGVLLLAVGAAGGALITTVAVVVYVEQPPDAVIVYVTVYVPDVDVLGVTAPVDALSVKPAGDAV